MDLKIITLEEKEEYNKKTNHIIQSWEWGQFRQALDTPVLRYGLYQENKLTSVFQLTLHKIPYLSKYIGYLGKGPFPDNNLAQALLEIGKQKKCAAIKVEPDFLKNAVNSQNIDPYFKYSSQTHFAQYNFLLDLTLSEEKLLENMHPKTRYNIKVAKKHQVWIEERDDEEAFQIYLQLYFETVKRQGYFGHNQNYHYQNWQIFKTAKMARILIAFYKTPEGQTIPLASWMLHNFKDTLYYFYGGSSKEYQNVMAPTLLAWEAIKLGKKLMLKKFDFGGGLSPNSPSDHPWQGFHRFKQGLGANLVEYMGSYDLIINPFIYYPFNFIDSLDFIKMFLLKIVG